MIEISTESEMVPMGPSGDLTWNDPYGEKFTKPIAKSRKWLYLSIFEDSFTKKLFKSVK